MLSHTPSPTCRRRRTHAAAVAVVISFQFSMTSELRRRRPKVFIFLQVLNEGERKYDTVHRLGFSTCLYPRTIISSILFHFFPKHTPLFCLPSSIYFYLPTLARESSKTDKYVRTSTRSRVGGARGRGVCSYFK